MTIEWFNGSPDRTRAHPGITFDSQWPMPSWLCLECLLFALSIDCAHRAKLSTPPMRSLAGSPLATLVRSGP